MRNVLSYAVMLAIAALVWASGCDTPRSRSRPPADAQESHQESPDLVPTYSLWIETSGLGADVVRLSVGGRAAIDVQGDGRTLAIQGLREDASYSVWVDKAPERLDCTLSEGSGTGETLVNGRVNMADVTLALRCRGDEVRLAKLSLFTRDARMVPDFDAETLAYSLEGYHVNDRAWLEIAPLDAEATVRVRLEGVELELGAGTMELPLALGTQALEIELTAASGRSRRYDVQLSRPRERSVRELHVPGVDADASLQAVALSTEYLAVSHSTSAPAGVVDVFRRTPEGWLHDATLRPTRKGSDDPYDGTAYFGDVLAFSGEWLAVAAPGYTLATSGTVELSPSLGAVFLYRRDAGAWVEQARLEPLERKPYDQFGLGLAMHGDLLAIGNPRGADIEDGGLVDIYRLGPDGTWAFTQTLRGDFLEGEAFGSSIAANDSHLAVAAPGWARVYVFAREGTELVPDGTLEAPPRKDRPSSPGHVLAFGDGLLATGSDEDSLTPLDLPNGEVGKGVVNLFRRDDEGWVLTQRLPAPEQPAPPEGNTPPRFGHALAFTSDALWAGAPSDMRVDGLLDSGLMYTFALSGKGVVAEAPEVAPLMGSRVGAHLGAALAAATDGAVAVCEPDAQLTADGERGIVHLLY